MKAKELEVGCYYWCRSGKLIKIIKTYRTVFRDQAWLDQFDTAWFKSSDGYYCNEEDCLYNLTTKQRKKFWPLIIKGEF